MNHNTQNTLHPVGNACSLIKMSYQTLSILHTREHPQGYFPKVIGRLTCSSLLCWIYSSVSKLLLHPTSTRCLTCSSVDWCALQSLRLQRDPRGGGEVWCGPAGSVCFITTCSSPFGTINLTVSVWVGFTLSCLAMCGHSLVLHGFYTYHHSNWREKLVKLWDVIKLMRKTHMVCVCLELVVCVRVRAKAM